MTLTELIDYTNAVKPNSYGDADVKLRWINEVHGLVEVEVLNKKIEDIEYISNINLNRVLEVPDPYSRLYIYYFFAMIDFLNGDYEKYKMSSLAFENEMKSYAKWCLRNKE